MKALKSILLLSTLLVGFNRVPAQVVIEEEITTDTVNILTADKAKSQHEKSPRLAMMANLLVPGLGHKYLGKEGRAMVYFASEALCIFGLIYSETYSKKMFKNSKSYAWKYAATNSTRRADDEYWKIIGNKYYKNYKEYNYEMELIGETDKKYVEPDETWYWEDDYYQTRYRDIRKTATTFHVVSSFFLGAMILNRAISFIDVRIASKYTTLQSVKAEIRLEPLYSLNKKEVGISLTGNF